MIAGRLALEGWLAPSERDQESGTQVETATPQPVSAEPIRRRRAYLPNKVSNIALSFSMKVFAKRPPRNAKKKSP